MKRNIGRSVALLCTGLSGCSTTSFAPPNVNLTKPQTASATSEGKCSSQIVDKANAGSIGDNVEGARALVENFVLVYRCQARKAADGRQGFEVPALLVGAGAATAVALGAGPNVAIAAGATTAVLGSGKAYYAPQMKAQIYDHALDALLCIKSQAVGTDAYDATVSQTNKVAFLSAGGGGSKVSFSAEQRYHAIVTSALFSVERVLAQRLNTLGTFDPAGAIAEIKALEAEKQKAEDEKKAKLAKQSQTNASDDKGAEADKSPNETPDKGKVDQPAANTDSASKDEVVSLDDATKDIETTEKNSADAAESPEKSAEGAGNANNNLTEILDKMKFTPDAAPAADDMFDLDLSILQPALQLCVVRAKL